MFQCALDRPSHHLPPADIILLNLSLANLLTSVFRTVPIFISDLGLNVSLAAGWCRLFMLLWVWWRAVGCWATLTLSAFHYATLRRKRVCTDPQAGLGCFGAGVGGQFGVFSTSPGLHNSRTWQRHCGSDGD